MPRNADSLVDYPVANVRTTSPYGDTRAPAHRKGHFGVDLAAPAGTAVLAPEDSTVVSFFLDNTTKPFTNYGPGGVLLRGDHTGYYHLLAHLNPLWWNWNLISAGNGPMIGRHYNRGDQVGVTAESAGTNPHGGNHVHWEVRRRPSYPDDQKAENTLDPVALVEEGGGRPFVDDPDPEFPWVMVLSVAAGIWLLSR